MLLEMGLIAGGIPAGWVLRRNAAVVTRVNEALAWTVRVMLFLLGLALGLDDALLGQLKSLGLYAVLISSFSVAGCFLVARMLGRHVFLEYAPGKGGAAAGERGGSRGSFGVGCPAERPGATGGRSRAFISFIRRGAEPGA